MNERGQIKYRERAGQLRDFSGLLFGKITPTDIDGLIEYHNKAYVIIETKVDGAKVPYGQRLALERLCDDLQATGKPTMLLIATHNTPCQLDIDVSLAIVDSMRYKKKWYKSSVTVRAMIERFLDNIDAGS